MITILLHPLLSNKGVLSVTFIKFIVSLINKNRLEAFALMRECTKLSGVYIVKPNTAIDKVMIIPINGSFSDSGKYVELHFETVDFETSPTSKVSLIDIDRDCNLVYKLYHVEVSRRMGRATFESLLKNLSKDSVEICAVQEAEKEKVYELTTSEQDPTEFDLPKLRPGQGRQHGPQVIGHGGRVRKW